MKNKNQMLVMVALTALSLQIPKAMATGSTPLIQKATEVSATDKCGLLLQNEEKIKKEALEKAVPFYQYFKELGQKVLEREYLLKITQLALLTKEHLLLVGPPGNAKSMYANMAYGNIMDGADPSYFKTQMTFETTLSDTHGPVDFRAMETEGKVVRRYDEGILGSKLAFLDEIFDMRPNGLRSILDVLAERAHGQGSKVHKGKTWSVIAASNRYISQVYEQFGLGNQPQAVLDRMAFAAYIPPEFEQVGSYRKLIKWAKGGEETPLPELHFQDVEKLQAMVPMVEIPDHISDLLSLLVYRLRPEIEAKEDTSRRDYLEQKQSGENPLPPWRATKYMSLRTLGKAAGVLKGLVVLNWLESDGTRKLTANLDDLEGLEIFFALNGPKDEVVQNALDRSTDPHERAQLETIMRERGYFRDMFKDLKEEFTQATTAYNLQDLAQGVHSFKSMLPIEQSKFLNRLRDTFMEAETKKITEDTPQSEVTPDRIAATSISESMRDWLEALENQGARKGEAHEIIETWKKESKNYTEKKRLEEKEREENERRVKEQERRQQEIQDKEAVKDVAAFVKKAGLSIDASVLKRVNPDALKQVKVEKGTYMMGSPKGEKDRFDDEDQHEVTISKSFKLGKFPVTQFIYYVVTKENPSYFKDAKYAEDGNEHWVSPEGVEMNLNHPVEQVSPEMADKFVEKWNIMFPSNKVRLPREGEWEKAARAGTTTAYPHGNDPAGAKDKIWFTENSGNRTHAVGKMPLNAEGLGDMLGNVWEIVADNYGEYPKKAVTDPTGDPSGSFRVIRGGGWNFSVKYVRSAQRFNVTPDSVNFGVGFRLASD